MHLQSLIAILGVIASTAAHGSVVRVTALPDGMHGTWAASADACSKSDEPKIVIAAKKYTRSDAACEVLWVTVTAAPNRPNYSARSRCVDQTTGKTSPPSALLFRLIDSDHIFIGSDEGSLQRYQRCP